MTFGARPASAAGSRPTNISGGSMTWSSTEITTCCRRRGSGSGSSAIPDDYGRFFAAVNAIYVINTKLTSGLASRQRRVCVYGEYLAPFAPSVHARSPERTLERFLSWIWKALSLLSGVEFDWQRGRSADSG